MYPPRIQCRCENPRCGSLFMRTPSAVAGGEGRFCSRACRWAMIPRIECTCLNLLCRKIFFVAPSKLNNGRSKYCSKSCAYKCAKPVSSFESRFWDKVAICEHGQECIFCCWEWQAGRHASGHPIFHKKIDGVWKIVPAQVQAWELLNAQPLPEGMMGLHYCNWPPCTNPMHIYPGTKSDNAKDALRAGSLPHQAYIRGEAVNTAKLTAVDIPVIRHLREQGWSYEQIGRDFGVTLQTIFSIVHRKSWKHIP